MDFVIVTGLSGAGKTNALHTMEDMGFFCADNIPPQLISTFYNLCENSKNVLMKRVALVVDIRAGDVASTLKEQLDELTKSSRDYKILFLEAKKEILLVRYKETRRKHPLLDTYSVNSLSDALELEYELLTPIKMKADYIVDTSHLTIHQLVERISTLFSETPWRTLRIACVSFGFKYGIPMESDLLFDVRCFENPFYIKELKHMTGLDPSVSSFVLGLEETQAFLDKLFSIMDFLVPLYKKEGKSQLVIAIGCTGGKHRSVTVANVLNSHFIENGEKSSIHHRDINKN